MTEAETESKQRENPREGPDKRSPFIDDIPRDWNVKRRMPIQDPRKLPSCPERKEGTRDE